MSVTGRLKNSEFLLRQQQKSTATLMRAERPPDRLRGGEETQAALLKSGGRGLGVEVLDFGCGDAGSSSVSEDATNRM